MEHVSLATVGDIYLLEIVYDVGRNALNAVLLEEIVHHVLLHYLKLDKHVFFALMLAKHAMLEIYLNALHVKNHFPSFQMNRVSALDAVKTFAISVFLQILKYA